MLNFGQLFKTWDLSSSNDESFNKLMNIQVSNDTNFMVLWGALSTKSDLYHNNKSKEPLIDFLFRKFSEQYGTNEFNPISLKEKLSQCNLNIFKNITIYFHLKNGEVWKSTYTYLKDIDQALAISDSGKDIYPKLFNKNLREDLSCAKKHISSGNLEGIVNLVIDSNLFFNFSYHGQKIEISIIHKPDNESLGREYNEFLNTSKEDLLYGL